MKFYLRNLLILFVLLLISSCSSDSKTQKKEIEATQVYIYDSWNRATYKNIKIIYPPDHPFKEKMNDYAKIYKTVLRRNAQFFGIPEPSDTIEMFYFTGFGQGLEIANSEFPTVRNDSIFYWSGNKFGVTAAMYMLQKWTNTEPKLHGLLFNGIMRLLDASGRDYHAMTLAFIDSSKFIPLEKLLIDERLDYKWEAYQSAEAASFVDYFVFKFGIDNFKQLYESQLPFDATVLTLCNMDLNALQKDWLQVIYETTKKNNN